MRRVLGTVLAAFLAALAIYVSRYWIFRFWDREGLLGVETLRPQGGLLRQYLRGTDAAPFDILLWGLAVFLVLTVLQFVWNRIFPS